MEQRTNKAEELLRKVNEQEREKEILKRELERVSADFKKYSQSMDEIIEECKNLQAGMNVSNSTEVIEALKKEIEELKHQIQELSLLAYRDPKFETNNVNSFNKRFFDKEKCPSVVAVVDVWNMKSINEEFDESIGDDVIRFTLETLNNTFGKENVYRTRGAQFSIILDEGTYAKAKGMLEGVKEELLQGKDIEIVYGYAIINSSDSREEAYENAKKEMLSYRIEEDRETGEPGYCEVPISFAPPMGYIPGNEMIFTNEMLPQDSEEKIEEEEVIEKEPEVSVTNPNISPNIYERTYPEYENIIEADSTSIDLAYELMNMHNNKNK